MKRLLLAAILLLAATVQADSWRFALIGDTPYSADERRELPRLLGAIAAEHPAFIVHAGDFKSGNARCSDALFRDRHALFDAAAVPFIYVPGDNEWTDCSRVLAGGFDPLERLNRLREIFFADRFSLVEVPADRANDIIQALRGTKLRGRKVVVRFDRDA